MSQNLFMTEKTSAIRHFWNLVRLEKTDIFSIYFYATLSGLLQLSVPIGLQAIIGFVLGASMSTSIYVLIALVVVSVFIVGILQINQMKIIERIQQRIFTRYAFDFAEKIPKFDLYKTDQYYLPEKVNRFFDTLSLQKGFSKLLLDIPTALIQIFFGLILLAFYHPFFITRVVILVFVFWLVLHLTRKTGLESSIEESIRKDEVIAWLQEIAKSIVPFKFSQETDLNLKTTDKLVVSYLIERTKHFKVLLFQYRVLVFLKTLITAFLLGIGVYLLINEKLNIGEFIAAEIVILTIIAAVEKLIKNLDTVFDVLTAFEKLASVSENYSENIGILELDSNNIALELKDFSFAYPNAQPILKNINLIFPANSIICIKGNENSGKSTLLKILCGNYSHFTGNILFNKIPLESYNLEEVRQKMGVYLGDPEIFTGTVLENITMGNEEITPQFITQKAEEIGFENFTQDLLMGYLTPIDAGGKGLSKSLARKIALLRALVLDSYLIILEEPWYGLDQDHQAKLMNYLLALSSSKTVIVATNDEDFAERCHYRYLLTDGKVEAQ